MKKPIPMGFKAAGVACGIKKNGDADLGAIVSDRPAAAAAVFTRNRVKAAPVQLGIQRMGSRRCQAIVVNSGNANCCTGGQGLADARETTRLLAEETGIAVELVQAASTGVIGEPLPMACLRQGVPALAAALRPDGFDDLARAIMTTDTVPKRLSRTGQAGGQPYTLTAVAKGAGMIRPDMATMLCFVATDIDLEAAALTTALKTAVDLSFNRITIDGDTSTNDTVLLMANGMSGACPADAGERAAFQALLDELLIEMARWLVKDGEGVTKLVEIAVRGAGSDAEARQVADTIAHSPLVKTALFGEDANWGRILAAAGRAGVAMDAGFTDILFNNVLMFTRGRGQGREVEAQATEVLKTDAFTITVDLGQGNGRASVITCDFSVDYVRINADYRS